MQPGNFKKICNKWVSSLASCCQLPYLSVCNHNQGKKLALEISNITQNWVWGVESWKEQRQWHEYPSAEYTSARVRDFLLQPAAWGGGVGSKGVPAGGNILWEDLFLTTGARWCETDCHRLIRGFSSPNRKKMEDLFRRRSKKEHDFIPSPPLGP